MFLSNNDGKPNKVAATPWFVWLPAE